MNDLDRKAYEHASSLARQICGCADTRQHKGDVKLLLSALAAAELRGKVEGMTIARDEILSRASSWQITAQDEEAQGRKETMLSARACQNSMTQAANGIQALIAKLFPSCLSPPSPTGKE